MRYRVAHSTEYHYSAQVINGHTVAHLRPRDTPTQTVLTSEVWTDPVADHVEEHLDSFGNHVSYRAVEQVHDRLVVTGVGGRREAADRIEVRAVVGDIYLLFGARRIAGVGPLE